MIIILFLFRLSINTVRRAANWLFNSFYDLQYYNDRLEQLRLKFRYAQVRSAMNPGDLAECFRQCFVAYEPDTFKKDLDSLWSPSFSSVYLMEKAVCTGAAGVNLYLANRYCAVFGITPKKITMFGIWYKKSLEGHAMTMIIQESGDILLLDYDRNIALKSQNDIKDYFRLNYGKGLGTIDDYFIFPFPAVKSYRV